MKNVHSGRGAVMLLYTLSIFFKPALNPMVSQAMVRAARTMYLIITCCFRKKPIQIG